MKAFLLRWMVTTFAVFVTAPIVGIQYQGLDTLFAASLLLGVMNAVVRPVLLLLSLPFILVTLGFFILVVNALMLEAVSFFLPSFHVPSLGTAFFGALLISIVSWLVSAFFRGPESAERKGFSFSPGPFSSGAPGGGGRPAPGEPEIKQAKGRVIR